MDRHNETGGKLLCVLSIVGVDDEQASHQAAVVKIERILLHDLYYTSHRSDGDRRSSIRMMHTSNDD